MKAMVQSGEAFALHFRQFFQDTEQLFADARFERAVPMENR
jgi:hypothetical protein